MTKAISVRLDTELLMFIDTIQGASTRSDKVRGVLLWLKQYQTHYLGSVQEHLQSCMTDNPEGFSEKSCEEKILEA